MKITINAPLDRQLDAMHTAMSYIANYGGTDRPRLRDCVLYGPPDVQPQTHTTAVWGTREHVRVRVMMRRET